MAKYDISYLPSPSPEKIEALGPILKRDNGLKLSNQELYTTARALLGMHNALAYGFNDDAEEEGDVQKLSSKGRVS